MKRRYMKIAAGLTAIVLSAGFTYIYADSRDTGTYQMEYSDDNGEYYSETVIPQKTMSGLDVKKTETVYVNASADGSSEKITVSDWITNPDSYETIYDVSELKNIQNIKGYEEYYTEGDKIVWKAGGSDICYQGTSYKTLPVEMNVSYTLDGNSISPEELAGKSGKVSIRFDYVSNQKKEVSVNGKNYNLYVPFIAVTGMLLDSEKFTNVETTNGKTVSDGNRFIVTGFAVPGVSEDLSDISSEIINTEDIPSYFEVTADVSDFSLDTTLTVFTNEFFSSADTEIFDIESLKNDIDKMADASSQLSDGSSELYEGMKELLLKTGDLTSGVSELCSGAGTLHDGTARLTDGSEKLENGLNELKNGIGQMKSGIDEISENSDALRKGSSDFRNGLELLNDSLSNVSSDADDLEKLIAASSELKKGINTLFSGVTDLRNSLSSEAMKTTLSENGLDADALCQANQQFIGTAESQIVTLNTALDKLNGISGNEKQTEEIRTQIESLENTVALIKGNNAYIDASENYIDMTGAAAAQLNEGLKKLSDSYSEFDSEIVKLAQRLADTSKNIEKLKESVYRLAYAYRQLDSSVTAYTSGVDALKNGSSSLLSGVSSLSSGASELGAGIRSVSDGAEKLKNGLSDLSDGTEKLTEGIQKLNDGSEKLNSGMNEFNENGTGKLEKIFRNDIASVSDIFKAMCTVSSEYRSYSGISDNMDGSVKFIFETGSIG